MCLNASKSPQECRSCSWLTQAHGSVALCGAQSGLCPRFSSADSRRAPPLSAAAATVPTALCFSALALPVSLCCACAFGQPVLPTAPAGYPSARHDRAGATALTASPLCGAGLWLPRHPARRRHHVGPAWHQLPCERAHAVLRAPGPPWCSLGMACSTSSPPC